MLGRASATRHIAANFMRIFGTCFFSVELANPTKIMRTMANKKESFYCKLVFSDDVLVGDMPLGDTGKMRKLENMVWKSAHKNEAVNVLKGLNN